MNASTSHPGPARTSTWPIVLVMGTAAAYTAYSAYNEVGLAGWINHAQQALFGGYMTKLSALLTFSIVGIGLAVAVDRWSAWRGVHVSAPPMAAVDAAAPAVPAIRRWIGLWLGLMAVTWGLGLGAWGWQAWQGRADEQATFVVADPDAPRPAEAHGYLALSGRLRRDLALEHQVGSGSARRTEHLLVPFTATAADPSPQRPVRYVVRMQPGLWLRNATGAPLQVHDEAPLAVPAAQAFAQAGIPVHADARIVRIVQAPASASATSTRSARDLRTLLQVCAGASVMFTLAVVVLATAERRRAAAASG